MTRIKFTANVVKTAKGCYIARSPELSIVAEPESTQRGAIKNLKDVVLTRLGQAARNGQLTALLDEAGYLGEKIYWGSSTLESPRHFDPVDISLPLPYRLAVINRTAERNREADEERLAI